MAFSIWYNEKTLPETVWGYKCYGFYPTCDVDICVVGVAPCALVPS